MPALLPILLRANILRNRDGGGTIDEPANYFITTWKVEAGDPTITIPTALGTFNYDISWDYNPSSPIWDEGKTGNATQDYGAAGTYTVAIRGNFPSISFNNVVNRLKIMSVEQWGDVKWESLFGAFDRCGNLIISAPDSPDLRNVSFLNAALRGTKILNGNINNWDTSNITNMSSMFQDSPYFNSELNLWDVSNVLSMNSMFRSAINFDQDLGDWNVSNVLNLSSFLRDVTLSISNYDSLLIGWASRPVKQNLNFHGGNSKYSSAGKVGRDILISKGWTIVDGGPV